MMISASGALAYKLRSSSAKEADVLANFFVSFLPIAGMMSGG